MAVVSRRIPLAGRTTALGADHNRSLQSRIRLAYVFAKLGRYDEAEAAAREVIAASSRTLGPDHYVAISVEDVLGQILLATDRPAEAERMLVGAHLGMSLAQLERPGEATAAWDAIADDLPPGEAETRDFLAAVVGHYERWHAADPDQGYKAKAAAWGERLAAEQAR